MAPDVRRHRKQIGPLRIRVQQTASLNARILGCHQNSGKLAAIEKQEPDDEPKGDEDIDHHRRPSSDSGETNLRERQSYSSI